MTASDQLDWYVVQVKPNAAVIAERNLTRQGFESFMPSIERDERNAPGFKRQRRPLFPGYLFVRFSPLGAGWRAISNTRGVARLVTFGPSGVRPVDPALVQNILGCTDHNGIFHACQDPVAGDAVVVLTGPFTDVLARIHRLDDAGRAWVLFDLMGRQTRVQVRREQLVRA